MPERVEEKIPTQTTYELGKIAMAITPETTIWQARRERNGLGPEPISIFSNPTQPV